MPSGIRIILFCLVASHGSAAAEGLTAAVVAAEIRNDHVLEQKIIVVYRSDHPIEVNSLGNDDILVGSRRLIGTGLDDTALKGRLQSHLAGEQSREITATYVLDKPDTGWRYWARNGLAIETQANSVSDQVGQQIRRKVIGLVDVHFANPPTRTLKASVIGNPEVRDLLQPHHDIEVAFTSTLPLNAKQFGPNDLYVQTWNDFVFPIRQSLAVDPDLPTKARATYRVKRPEDGWGAGPLRVYAQVLPPPNAWEWIGGIAVSASQELTITLNTEAEVSIMDEDDYTFEVIYTKTGPPFDLDSFNHDDLVIEQESRGAEGLWIALPRLISAQRDALPYHDRVVARYAIPRPETGWPEWQDLSPMVRLLPDSVQDQLGQSLPRQILGRVPLADDLSPSKQQLIFEDWVRELSKQLGLPKPPAKKKDSDQDGKTDLTEITYGTDLWDAASSNPLTLSASAIHGQTYLRVSLASRQQAFGNYIDLQGSSDGVHWRSAADAFMPILRERNHTFIVDRLTFRSRKPLPEMNLRFFRLQLREP